MHLQSPAILVNPGGQNGLSQVKVVVFVVLHPLTVVLVVEDTPCGQPQSAALLPLAHSLLDCTRRTRITSQRRSISGYTANISRAKRRGRAVKTPTTRRATAVCTHRRIDCFAWRTLDRTAHNRAIATGLIATGR